MEKVEVRVGVEEELFLIDEDGSLTRAADDVIVNAAELLKSDSNFLEDCWRTILGLDPEPNPAQIEYLTQPLPPDEVIEACETGRELIKKAAEELGLRVMLESMHPFESDPLPINGTHVNVMVKFKDQPYMTPKQMLVVYNWLWYNLPIIIAATANTPYCCGGKNLAASCRLLKSRVLKPNYRAAIKRLEKRPYLTKTQYYGRLRYRLRLRKDTEFEERVVAHPDGRRLVDVTPRGPASNVTGDENDSPTRNRVEVRAIDNQKSIKYLHDVVMLIVGLSLEALYMYEIEGKLPPNDPNHFDNRRAAIKEGINATFVINKKEIDAESALLEIINRVDKFLDCLGLRFISPLKNGEVELQKRPKLNVEYVYKDAIKYIGNYVEVILGSDKTVEIKGKKYTIPKGTKVIGKLIPMASYKYRTDNKGFVKDIIKGVITLGIKRNNVEIPLDKNDKIVNIMSELEYLMRSMRGLL
ncbi:hypothetical protein [Methanopyrus sp.]